MRAVGRGTRPRVRLARRRRAEGVDGVPARRLAPRVVRRASLWRVGRRTAKPGRAAPRRLAGDFPRRSHACECLVYMPWVVSHPATSRLWEFGAIRRALKAECVLRAEVSCRSWGARHDRRTGFASFGVQCARWQRGPQQAPGGGCRGANLSRSPQLCCDPSPEVSPTTARVRAPARSRH